MKKLIAVMLAVCVTTFAGYGAELQKGIDLTGLSSVSASQLNQLVDNARPASNRGLVYVGTTAPTITGTNAYRTNYIWVDISALPYTLRTYQTGSWVTATIGADSVNTGNIVDAAVTNPKLAANAVNTTNISDNAVTESKIAAGSVTTSKIGALQITSALLAADSVVTAKIGDGQVTAQKLAAGAVGPSTIGAQGIYGTNLVNGTITSTQIAGGTISGTNIAGATIVSSNIANATITKANLAFGTPTNAVITASSLALGGLKQMAHGQGAVPQMVRVVLVNVTTDAGWDTGDEVDINAFTSDSYYPFAAVYADTTNVNVRFGDNAGFTLNKDTGNVEAFTIGNWTLKAYITYTP